MKPDRQKPLLRRIGRHLNCRCHGFTLIELLVVIAVIAIFAALAFPGVVLSQTARLDHQMFVQPPPNRYRNENIRR